jgi:hypothetical protein
MALCFYATGESERASVTHAGCEDEMGNARGHTLLFGLIITQHAEVALTSNVHPKYTISKLHVVIIL